MFLGQLCSLEFRESPQTSVKYLSVDSENVTYNLQYLENSAR